MPRRRDEPGSQPDAALSDRFRRYGQVEGRGGAGREGGDDGLAREILDNLGQVSLPSLAKVATNAGR